MLNFLFFIVIGSINMSQANLWTNWAGTQKCNAKILHPKNTTDLISIVNKATQENIKIHAYGSSHSWSDIVCTDGYLINTNKLNKIISVDLDKKQVIVQAGIKLKDLNKKLEKLNLCLSNQGAITEQSIAGAISTATHGSGKTGTYASFITQLKLLTANGEIQNCSENLNPELFSVTRTSIGALGIITEVTVQCEQLFNLERTIKNTSWEDALNNYQKLLETNDYMKFHWFEADDSVSIITHNRVKEKTKNSGISYKMLSGTKPTKYVEEEIAIPIINFIQAANAARELLKKEIAKNPIFSGILFRFVSAETNNLLSPASGKDVVYFSVTTESTSGYENFYKEFYNLMLKFGGRPHWGKINYLTQDDVKKLYANNFDKFVEIRKKLDPNGLFSNVFTKRIFGW